MAKVKDAMVQRGHNFAIIDEVDSILIDEARTPLIISGPAAESAQLWYQFAGIVRTLRAEDDYEVDEEKRTVIPTEAGIEKVERQLGVDNLYDAVAVNYVHHLTQALLAKELYRRDKDYLVSQGEVRIIDEFTGRTLDGRRWSDGLHQAVEAKERVRIKEENHTWATVTLQNYFRMYHKLSGMTGTAETEASEFANTYELPVVPIPPNRPLVRIDQPDLIFKTEAAKFEAAVEDVLERHEAGQPILIGTASVAHSEELGRMLAKRGIPHEVLNAKQHFREAEIVAQAGRIGAVTVATNMAGRGVDIILGGNPEGLAAREANALGLDLDTEEGQAAYRELEEKFAAECAAHGEEVRAKGGLYVLGSERHESRRIDNQLRGRSGRQGDPGESRFFLSLEDELMRLFATGAMNWVMGRALPDDVPIEAKMVTKAIERAQTTVEGRNAESRKDVLKYDDVMNEQRKVIYAQRYQVIDGEDLQEFTVELLERTMTGVVAQALPSEYPEEWDLPRLILEISQYYPTKFVAEDFAEAASVQQITESVIAEAMELYAERDEQLLGGAETARQLERDIMLQIIDQRWQDHLADMDYLREGIGLRAMGNQDPLVAWQREGFAMFNALMDGIADDYLRHVFHVTVKVEQAPEMNMAQASYIAADDPVQEATMAMALATPEEVEQAAALAGGSQLAPGGLAEMGPEAEQKPVVKTAHEKIGRNEPCHCGSGKKFKLCHGAN
jgi:preprotein translocase subunit SecA